MNEASPLPAAGDCKRGNSQSGKIAVLLVNLGTPDGADAASVRRYLREFLTDARVIEKQGPIWKLVLHGVILRIRPRRKAHDYRKIWDNERNESPLKTITRSQAEKLASKLAALGPGIVVDWAMRYGNPSLAARIAYLLAERCERVLVIPLYPQYCAATTATVCDEMFRVLARLRHQPALRVAPPYYDDPVYIDALASSTSAALGSLGFKPQVILASFHGVPQAYVESGDPYQTHCVETIRLLRQRLGFDEAALRITFQSRFGRDKWLGPATIETVEALAKSGIKRVAVITPGFASDCLETLEEIAGDNAHVFKQNGGESFAALPCLNDSEEGMKVILHLALRELSGWL